MRDRSLATFHAQPAYSPNHQFVVVGDLWLSNKTQLLKKLGIAGTVTQTDAEIVAHLWEKCGVESLEQLEGMFAFVVWDRQRQELWLGRDRVGTKTLARP